VVSAALSDEAHVKNICQNLPAEHILPRGYTVNVRIGFN
jgi:hypothetical protein